MKRVVNRLFYRAGYRVTRLESDARTQFRIDARPHNERHNAQTLETVAVLRERYREAVFGVVTVWSMVELLAHVVDRIDVDLMNASQEVHVLQLLEGMIADGVDDESLLLTAILHDLGKVLALVGEDPANLFGCNAPIGEYGPGVGLDHCVFQWNHDEFGYTRFNGRVPDHVAWLIRYHSMLPETCLHLMDARDRDYYERYWRDFNRWDCQTKSIHRVPRTTLADYREIVERAFPEPIPF